MGEIKIGKYVILDNLLYTDTDEYVRIEGEIAIVGITDYAQKKLRDIVGIELPRIDTKVRAGDIVATVESVKAASDIYSPLSGIIIEVNEKLLSNPELMNKDPYGEGWIFKIKMVDNNETKSLLTPEKYIEKIRSSGE
ncbi:glycine cleavage system protein GcvH [Acidianus sulfidivorans JP7]|uniref:Probable glycine cleavage system H protein n=1 Tax=Acidianus sulfidivorans JP7 TaxID=619593 RepID=A0A2U9IP24_9CREN|nr:glycine cleavage system protein GcvH [Acidianus sulfidivorans]AWR97736.1 glycine cleavage system protein GcvH [Acidianus sulfidivorans JP7]